MEKLHDSVSYLQQNAEVNPTRVVGSWPNVQTFVVCSQQNSRDTTWNLTLEKAHDENLHNFLPRMQQVLLKLNLPK